MMSRLRQVLRYVITGVRWVFGAAKTTRIPRWVYLTVHILLVALVTILLGIFSPEITEKLGRVTRGPYFVREYFWGVFFLVFYLFVRLVLYLISLFWLEEESEFPDIEHAWGIALDEMERGGLDVSSLPLFLVMGLPEREEAHLFSGARLDAKVVAPNREETGSPLRFYANRDALFITCPGISAVCRQLAEVRVVPMGTGTIPAPGMTMQAGMMAGATLPPGGAMAAGATLMPGYSAGATMQPGQMMGTGTLSPQSGPAEAGARTVPLSKSDLHTCERRARFLCQLISRARAPFCPFNGLLLVTPAELLDPALDPAVLRSARSDLRALHRECQLLFPVVVLVPGIDASGGLSEFLQRARSVDPQFSSAGRAGSRFPMGHQVEGNAADAVVEESLEWFRRWIYSAFAKGLDNPSNSQLYRMLCSLDARRERLKELFRTTFSEIIPREPVRLSGLYFCGFDAASRRYVFVRDVLGKLSKEQDDVAWSQWRVHQDQVFRNWGYALYVLVAVLLLVDGWLIWEILRSRG